MSLRIARLAEIEYRKAAVVQLHIEEAMTHCTRTLRLLGATGRSGTEGGIYSLS